MVTGNTNTAPGFMLYGNSNNTHLLLPTSTVAEIGAQAELAELVVFEKKTVLEAAENTKKIQATLVTDSVKKIKPGPRDIEIFSELSIETLRDNFGGMDDSTKRASSLVYSSLTNGHGRYRAIPFIDNRDILSLASTFENMAEPIKHLAGEIALMARLPCADFHLTPILLLGGPGIGKTAFASALAKVLKLPYCKLKGSEPAFSLTGSHPSWARAKPGMLIDQMSLYDSAAPLFLVDEMDKHGGEQYPIGHALLDLLEPENARNFKDELFQIEFNASHAVWILTANTTAGVSAPLLSRMITFDIPAPGIAQRKRIIEADLESLRARTGVMVRIKPGQVRMLAERLDLDLRKLTRIVRDCFIAAIGHNLHIGSFDLPLAVKPAMGFF